ncbi:hypothetical protein F9874_07975 [Glaesserella parasuis]|uniref:Uncharacterized protein n=1 Tax=Glaesserella parasuis TaxID=738 RepID=A0A859IGK8_GLAPU|nr:hypothetical protein [Glaesserella parasuis]MDG6268058.1 hypothetical protein [Glaesserella parasuis]MDO9759065.1 hypothetical protein [Glaesserella parasuis]MWQ00138.1 hypothetical protein [Glaesserella parasuis]MWQ41536.1 hypothetical protein [Glaesserella parasuis]MWQ45519.1 hypothetical protein [Glaesserella parasuis]
MPLPFILAGAAVAAAGFGVKKGFDAKSDFSDATRYQKLAREESDEANNKLENQKNSTNISLENYGVSKKNGISNINLFDSFICYPDGERRSNQLLAGKNFANDYPKIIITHEEEAQILRDLNIIDEKLTSEETQHKIHNYNVEMKALGSALEAVAGGSLAGLAAGGGTYFAVGKLGMASTGAAIKGLSGIAAKNATLAWLGGGSIASGGFGIAGGTVVLGGLVAGPLLAIGGAVIASKAATKKDEALELLERVRGQIAKLDIVVSKLNAIERYSDECRYVFDKLNNYYGNTLLSRLEELAKRNITFKELNHRERSIIYACYELNYVLYDFINEPILNENSDDALPYDQRKAMMKSQNLEYTNLII